MKVRSILSIACLTGMMSVVHAADLLPRDTYAASPVRAAPIFTWSGLYVGVNAGAAFSGGDGGFAANGIMPLANYGTGFAGQTTGFTGGGQIGLNFQTQDWVWGLETELGYLGRGNGTSIAVPAGAVAPYAVGVSGSSNDWFGTFRGRIGYSAMPALFYVTGGVAYGGSNSNFSVNYFDGAPCVNGCSYTAGSSSTRTGWTAGGGMEFSLTPNVSARVEYLHVDLGSKNLNLASAANPGTSFSATSSSKSEIVRAGLNLRFGGFSQPISARY